MIFLALTIASIPKFLIIILLSLPNVGLPVSQFGIKYDAVDRIFNR